MGIFNSFMKGMGFEGSESKEKIDDGNSKYANFDNNLASNFNVSEFKKSEDGQIPDFAAGIGGKNLIIYAPRDNNDIKILVDCIRRREACIVNLGQLKQIDADKILQFLSGAVYALRGSIKRLQGDLFLMTPEGINIMQGKK